MKWKLNPFPAFIEIYDTYEIEVKNTFGFEQSSVVLSCEISPPSASSYVHVIGWLENVDNQISQLDLRKCPFLSLLKEMIDHMSRSSNKIQSLIQSKFNHT